MLLGKALIDLKKKRRKWATLLIVRETGLEHICPQTKKLKSGYQMAEIPWILCSGTLQPVPSLGFG